MSRLKVGVLISGRGSNLHALIDACAAPDYPAEIALVVSNRPDAPGLEHANRAQIPALALDWKREFDSRAAYEEAVDRHLREAGVELVCLAGYMLLLGEDFVRRWEGRVINIHPSLLPLFKGLRPHQQALASGMRVSGCTVHYVVPEMDSGPIIGQRAVPVLPGDDAETLGARILEAEHRLYPECVRMIAEGRVRMEDGRAVFERTATASPADGAGP
ncbi:MAG: phosphoribosylglycinamide formyltransferase [Alphaproteobacteria bacterium]